MISSAGPPTLETRCTFIDAGHIVKFSGKDPVDGFDDERFRGPSGRLSDHQGGLEDP